MATVIPGSTQSNRDRAELIALRRLGTVDDFAKAVEVLADDPSDFMTGGQRGVVFILRSALRRFYILYLGYNLGTFLDTILLLAVP